MEYKASPAIDKGDDAKKLEMARDANHKLTFQLDHSGANHYSATREDQVDLDRLRLEHFLPNLRSVAHPGRCMPHGTQHAQHNHVPGPTSEPRQRAR